MSPSQNQEDKDDSKSQENPITEKGIKSINKSYPYLLRLS